MRRGELLGLRWCDVSLDAKELCVEQTRVKAGQGAAYGRPKTEKGRRTISLDDVTLAALRSWRKAQAEERLAWGPGYREEGLVFCRADGSPLEPAVVSQRFVRLSRDCGLPRLRFHDLRHSYATAALRAGVPTAVVSRRLRHASVSITHDVYQHLLPGMDLEAADRIAAAIDGV